MIDLKTWYEDADLYTPKRLMRYVLLWCNAGEATVVIDDKEFELKPYHVVTITSGQVHYFKEAASATGFVLSFTLDFFCKDDKDIELIFHNGLFCHLTAMK